MNDNIEAFEKATMAKVVNESLFQRYILSNEILKLLSGVVATSPQKGEYHSNVHGFAVAYLAWQLMTADGKGETEKLTMVAAALLHDYDHSAGFESEVVNIDRAIGKARILFSTPKFIKYGSGIDPDKVYALIEDTRYPYSGGPSTENGGYIRDADRLAATVEDNDDAIMALYRELGNAGKIESYPSVEAFKAFYEQQIVFIKSLECYSPAGKSLHTHIVDKAIQRFEQTASDYIKSISTPT